MDHNSMIAVIAAHRDGKQIERRSRIWPANWIDCSSDYCGWNFSEWDYRIAEPRWRDATIDDLHKCPLKCRVRNLEEEQWNDRLLEGYVCHSPKWRADSFRWRLCQVIDE